MLSSGNLDEILTGYYTKYDCSSGDLNLIGSMSKIEILKTLKYLYTTYQADIIKEIYEAKPTADLKPYSQNQSDEDEIGLNFKELDIFAEARILRNCSVVSFYKTVESLLPELDKKTLLEKISIFFKRYALNRHKVETLPTTLHLTSKSCSSKRFDLRPIVYEDKFEYELAMLSQLINQ